LYRDLAEQVPAEVRVEILILPEAAEYVVGGRIALYEDFEHPQHRCVAETKPRADFPAPRWRGPSWPQPQLDPLYSRAIPWRQTREERPFGVEEASMDWEQTEGVVAVEDAVGFFVHAVAGQEEREAGSDAAVVRGIEVDGLGDDEAQVVDAHTQLAGEVEEAKWRVAVRGGEGGYGGHGRIHRNSRRRHHREWY